MSERKCENCKVLRANNRALLIDKNKYMEMVEKLKKDIESLRKDELKLRALEDAGVDNWEWYELSMDLYNSYLEGE